VTPTEYDDENQPIQRDELPEDQQEFLKHYEALVSMLPWDVRSEEYHTFNDHLSQMLAQANRWGQQQAERNS
jgi:hypothetical protein